MRVPPKLTLPLVAIGAGALGLLYSLPDSEVGTGTDIALAHQNDRPTGHDATHSDLVEPPEMGRVSVKDPDLGRPGSPATLESPNGPYQVEQLFRNRRGPWDQPESLPTIADLEHAAGMRFDATVARELETLLTNGNERLEAARMASYQAIHAWAEIKVREFGDARPMEEGEGLHPHGDENWELIYSDGRSGKNWFVRIAPHECAFVDIAFEDTWREWERQKSQFSRFASSLPK